MQHFIDGLWSGQDKNFAAKLLKCLSKSLRKTNFKPKQSYIIYCVDRDECWILEGGNKDHGHEIWSKIIFDTQ